MTETVRPADLRFHRTKPVSAAVRLAQVWGCSEKTAECRLYGESSIFRQVGEAFAVMAELGLSERLAQCLDIVEAPLMGTGVLPYDAARLAAGLTDAAEDVAEMEYEANPCRATAEALIRKSAHDRLKAEQRERSLKERWALA